MMKGIYLNFLMMFNPYGVKIAARSHLSTISHALRAIMVMVIHYRVAVSVL